MPYYSLGGLQTTTSGALKGTAATWSATSGLKRHKWYDVIIGAAGNPNATDTYIQVDISRLTATTSIAGTTGTLSSIDQADGAASAQSLVNITTEPNTAIVTPSLMNFGLNQRNTTRWVASQESQYIVAPATNLTGLYCRVTSGAYTAATQVQVYVME